VNRLSQQTPLFVTLTLHLLTLCDSVLLKHLSFAVDERQSL